MEQVLDLREGANRLSLSLSPENAVEVVAETEWLQAKFEARLTLGERQVWAESLQTLLAEGAGARTLRADDGWIEATFVMAKRGDLHLSLMLQGGEERLNEIRLFLNLRQEELPEIVHRLSV